MIFFFENIIVIGLCEYNFKDTKALNYSAFKSFDFERTWSRLFLKRVAHTKFDIYVFIFIISRKLKIPEGQQEAVNW